MAKNTILCNHTQQNYEYEIAVGLKTHLVLQMDVDWDNEKSKIVSEMRAAHDIEKLDEDEFAELIEAYGLTDFGWNWMLKAYEFKSQEYIWFFLICEKKVQGACIVYHPKKSQLDGKDIFYIDYLATAYWNRNRPSYDKKYSKVGSSLISYIIDFLHNNFNYRLGFCLHSLPSAETYYMRLGMQPFGKDPNKENLTYFEACQVTAAKLVDAA